MNVRVIPHKRDKTKWAVDYRCPVMKKRKYESFASKKEALARKKELEGKEATGEYRPLHRRTWAEFVAEYREKVLSHKKWKTKMAEQEAIGHFERLCAPALVANINTRTIDEFKSKRQHKLTTALRLKWRSGRAENHRRTASRVQIGGRLL